MNMCLTFQMMFWMGNVFGKSKHKANSRVTDNDRAVLELKKARDQLLVYQKKINADLDKERNVAKQLLQQQRMDRAKTVLRRKRYKESLLDKTDKQLENLETMVSEIEMAEIQVKVVDGIKAGKEALTKIQQLMNLDDIEQLMDDTREAVQLQQQIDNTIATALSPDEEQEALDELEALLAADEAGDRAAVGDDVTPQLPDVPTDALPSIPQEPERDPRSSSSGRVAMAA